MNNKYILCLMLSGIFLAGINCSNMQESAINENKNDNSEAAFDACKRGDINILKLLITSDFDINAKNPLGETLLHIASKSDNLEIIKLLVGKGIKINAKDNYDNTPLHLAASSGSRETIEYLLSRGAKLEAKNKFGYTPLCRALRTYPDNKNIIPEFEHFQEGLEDNLSCFREGCEFYKNGQVQQAVDEWKKYIKDDWYNALVFQFILPPDFPDKDFIRYIKKIIPEDFQNIDNISARTGIACGYSRFYFSSLIISVFFDEDLFLKMLLNENPVTRAMGIICLAREYFAKYETNIYSIYKDSAEVSFGYCDLVGGITLGELAKNINESSFYIYQWAYQDEKPFSSVAHISSDKEKRQKEIIRFLIDKGADINTKSNSGDTPLYYAVSKCDIYLVALLISKGANLNVQNNGGETPLHNALLWCNNTGAEMVLKNGARVNIKDKEGNTPLHYAVAYGNPDSVKLLMENSADINTKNSYKQTPLQLGKDRLKQENIEMLLKYDPEE